MQQTRAGVARAVAKVQFDGAEFGCCWTTSKCHPDGSASSPADLTAAYDWQDDATRSYLLWVSIKRARLLIVRALKRRASP
jgi:hypothetical protein